MGATKKFQDLLTRTEVVSYLYSLFSFPFNGYKLELISFLLLQQNIKAHENRRQIFSTRLKYGTDLSSRGKIGNLPLYVVYVIV